MTLPYTVPHRSIRLVTMAKGTTFHGACEKLCEGDKAMRDGSVDVAPQSPGETYADEGYSAMVQFPLRNRGFFVHFPLSSLSE